MRGGLIGGTQMAVRESTGPQNSPEWRFHSTTLQTSVPAFSAGPFWQSFEKFRTSGSTALAQLTPGTVGTLQTKSDTYRILRDEDFQKLLGLASEAHRLKGGITIVLHAARVVAKHPDKESLELLIHSVSMLNESRILPERDGHETFEITPEEKRTNDGEDFDLEDVRRPVL